METFTENSREYGQEGERPLEKVGMHFEEEEEALALIEKFWRAMPHGSDIVRGVEQGRRGWDTELTFGDRTTVLKMRVGPNKGKWLVQIRGNHNPLSPDAMEWLKGEGIIEK